MSRTRVTDPELLAILNGQENDNKNTLVTDPELLKQLNGSIPNNPQQPMNIQAAQEPNWYDKLKQFNTKAAERLGFPATALKQLSAPGMPLNRPAEQMSAMAGIVNPELGLMRGGSTAGAILDVLRRTAGNMGELGVQSHASAALRPGATEEEALKSGAIGAGIGSLGLPFRTLGYAAEKINPQLYAGQLAEKIKGLYKSGRAEQRTQYDPIHAVHDPVELTTKPKEYFGFEPEIEQYFTPDIIKLYNTFKAKPTFENAHNLQSKMFQDAKDFKINTNKKENYQALKQAREQVNEKLEEYLKQNDPQAYDKLIKGREISRERVYPYTEVGGLEDITKIEHPIDTYDPKKLFKALQESPLVQLSQRSAQPSAHPLAEIERNLSRKMNRAQLAKYGIPAALGATGMAVNPTLGITASGIGGILGHYGSETAAKLMQNPELIKALESFEKSSHIPGRGAANYLLNEEQ